MTIDRFTVHIQIETRDAEGFSHAPYGMTYHLDHDADEQTAQQEAIAEATRRAQAEWSELANPPALF